MKILIDAGVGQKVADFLRESGHDVVDIADHIADMEDLEILEFANAEERLIITMDKDFGELAYLSKLPHAGILLLRMKDATGAEKTAAVASIFADHANELIGAFAVYNTKRLRIRKP